MSCVESVSCVDSLKDVIKQKNANNLKEIDAKELTLYQVFILDIDHLGGKLSSMNFDTNILLWSMQKLSAIFPTGAEEGHLHICSHVETRCMLVLFTLRLCVWCNMGIRHSSNHFVENSPSVMGYGHLSQTEPFCQLHPTCHSVTAVSN